MPRIDLRHRWSSGLLSLLFVFFLSEAIVTGCCDADLSQASIASAAAEAGQLPADAAPVPSGTHVCQCAHANSVFRSAPTRIDVMLVHQVPTSTAMPPLPPGRTLQPDPRPPIS